LEKSFCPIVDILVEQNMQMTAAGPRLVYEKTHKRSADKERNGDRSKAGIPRREAQRTNG
jgi:hypothetical protein